MPATACKEREFASLLQQQPAKQAAAYSPVRQRWEYQ